MLEFSEPNTDYKQFVFASGTESNQQKARKSWLVCIEFTHIPVRKFHSFALLLFLCQTGTRRLTVALVKVEGEKEVAEKLKNINLRTELRCDKSLDGYTYVLRMFDSQHALFNF